MLKMLLKTFILPFIKQMFFISKELYSLVLVFYDNTTPQLLVNFRYLLSTI